ncbi:MAG: dTDP-4-dehydrorhamnose reductase [Paludibacteraceae bacterium]|nr:dTDP-4-dehydrorhamnose reductase [Paludibacteraceae bacterium]
MSKILVTGSNGQLGNEMRVISGRYPQHEFVFTDVAELDICSRDAVRMFVERERPDYIVNCAAYTAVTKAETDIEKSYSINCEAVKTLAIAASENEAKVIHISTDYVFAGDACQPYTEDQRVNPQSVYGKTKYEGEVALSTTTKDYVILRTSWLYSSFGNNFVKTMIRLGKERERLTVVFDQVGDPTYAADLAEAVMTVVNAKQFVSGTYHFSNEGVCSWYDFTKAIHRLYGVNGCKVEPLESKDYPDKTPRPFYSVLNKSKFKQTYGMNIPYWYDSLEKCIELLKAKGE